MRAYIAVLMVGATVGLVACGKNDTKVYTDDKGNSAAVSSSGDHMTFTGSNGQKVEIGSGSSASANLPSYLPLYPGAKVTASVTGNGKDGSGGMVTFQTPAAPAEIIAFYKQKAGAAGMTDAVNADMGGTMMYTAGNDKTKNQMSVTAAKAGDATSVQLVWGMK